MHLLLGWALDCCARWGSAEACLARLDRIREMQMAIRVSMRNKRAADTANRRSLVPLSSHRCGAACPHPGQGVREASCVRDPITLVLAAGSSTNHQVALQTNA